MWQDQLIRTVHLIALHIHLDKKSLQIHTVTRKGQVSCIWHPRRLQGLPVSYSTGATGSSTGAGWRERIKQAGPKADHSHLSSAQVNDLAIPPLPNTPLCQFLMKHVNKFIFTLPFYTNLQTHTRLPTNDTAQKHINKS